MTEQEVIQLSIDVANLYDIEASCSEGYNAWGEPYDDIYLHDDWQRLMPLAIEHELHQINQYANAVEIIPSWFNKDGFAERILIAETYADHPTKERAVAVAILKALKAKAETK